MRSVAVCTLFFHIFVCKVSDKDSPSTEWLVCGRERETESGDSPFPVNYQDMRKTMSPRQSSVLEAPIKMADTAPIPNYSTILFEW